MSKNKPIMNHTKIIAYAILYAQGELDAMRSKCAATPGSEGLLKMFEAQWEPELEALKTLYKIETGVEYN